MSFDNPDIATFDCGINLSRYHRRFTGHVRATRGLIVAVVDGERYTSYPRWLRDDDSGRPVFEYRFEWLPAYGRRRALEGCMYLGHAAGSYRFSATDGGTAWEGSAGDGDTSKHVIAAIRRAHAEAARLKPWTFNQRMS